MTVVDGVRNDGIAHAKRFFGQFTFLCMTHGTYDRENGGI